MQKCDLCLESWGEGTKPICVVACPTRALDAELIMIILYVVLDAI
jgi:Fe-S-cluster-containing dehydrogenase component